MGKLLVKRGWALALVIHGLIGCMTAWSIFLAFTSTTGHLVEYCTEYCELHGCTHGNRFARFYPWVTRQVEGLYGLVKITGGDRWVGYQYVNIVVYCIFGGGLALVSILYLLSRRRTRTNPVRRWHRVLTSLLVPTLAIWLVPGAASGLFYSCVDLCLGIGYLMGYTLYEVYTIGFVFILPGALLTLLVLVGLKWIIVRKSSVIRLESVPYNLPE